MATKSIIDRVLILAAVICAAGLIWQLTVLLTSNDHGAPTQKADVAVASKPDAGPVSAPAATSSTAADVSPVRVVYPGDGDAGTPKTTIKAVDAPVAPASPPPSNPSPASAPAVTASARAAAQPLADQHSPAAEATSFDPAPSTSDPQPLLLSNGAAPQPDIGAPAPAAAGAQVASTEPAAPAAASQPPKAVPTQPQKAASGALLNINSASADALNHLSGGGHIGYAIVRHRPYKSIEDLVKRRILRRNVYEQIKRQIATQ